MPLDATDVGREGVLERVVTPGLTADRYGNPGLMVLATPALVELIERAAVRALAARLAPGERTVGTEVEIAHRAATPVGERIRIVARVSAVEDGHVWFDVTANDAHESIADGRHGRFLVDEARFLRRLERKRAG
jgi:fluoroacetyl-CoA thioesterase